MLTARDLYRMLKKITILGPDDCWEWTASHNGKGYGRFRIANRLVSPHRVMWELENNCEIPPDKTLSHRCGNAKCCNPNHLSIASPDLTLDIAREIRELSQSGYSQRRLGILFGVSQSLIGMIVNYRIYKEPIIVGRSHLSGLDHLDSVN